MLMKWSGLVNIYFVKNRYNRPVAHLVVTYKEPQHPTPSDLVSICKYYFYQFILLFSLFFVLFMGPTALFGIIHVYNYVISANFFLYLRYFQQKLFSFIKISEFQTYPKVTKEVISLFLFQWGQGSCRETTGSWVLYALRQNGNLNSGFGFGW